MKFAIRTQKIPGVTHSAEASRTRPIGTLCSAVFPEDLPDTGNVTCSIRPEALQLARNNGQPSGTAQSVAGQNLVEADRIQVIYLGETAQYELRVGDAFTLKALELNPKLTSGAGDRIQAVLHGYAHSQ